MLSSSRSNLLERSRVGCPLILYFPIFPIFLRSSYIFLYFQQIPIFSYNFMLVNRINTKMHHFQYEISKFSRGWYPRTPIVTIIDEVKVFQARCSTKTIAAYDVKKSRLATAGITRCPMTAIKRNRHFYGLCKLHLFTSWEHRPWTIVTKIWHNIARNFL